MVFINIAFLPKGKSSYLCIYLKIKSLFLTNWKL